jgi:hypothetical protein
MTTLIANHPASIAALGRRTMEFDTPEAMVKSLLGAAGLLDELGFVSRTREERKLSRAFADAPLYVDSFETGQRRASTWSIRVTNTLEVDADTLLEGIDRILWTVRVETLLAHIARWAKGERPDHVEPITAYTPRNS